MIKKLFLRLSFGSVLLSSSLYLTVAPASASPDVDWLDRWDKRVKITINSTNINAALTNFPVLIYSSTNSGENAEDVSFLFDEVGSNSTKIAVTTSDGTNQCYVEIEGWIHTNEQAWLWAKVPNVASNADTDLYIYYDNGQPDNTKYVGDTGESAAENVWNTNFVLVQHMKDETTSNTLDSTSNNNDGLKKAANEPNEVNGQIDKAQDFDSDDYAVVTTSPSLMISPSITLEAWVKLSADQTWRRICNKQYDHYELTTDAGNRRICFTLRLTTAGVQYRNGPALSIGQFYHIVGTYDGSTMKLYTNSGTPYTTSVTDTIVTGATSLLIGARKAAEGNLIGVIDEFRISNVTRSPAWIKACYETQRDHLLDFVVEENRPIPGTVFSIE